MTGATPDLRLPSQPNSTVTVWLLILARYDVSVRLSVRLSVTEMHWRIIANLGFKFQSKFTAHYGRGEE